MRTLGRAGSSRLVGLAALITAGGPRLPNWSLVDVPTAVVVVSFWQLFSADVVVSVEVTVVTGNSVTICVVDGDTAVVVVVVVVIGGEEVPLMGSDAPSEETVKGKGTSRRDGLERQQQHSALFGQHLINKLFSNPAKKLGRTTNARCCCVCVFLCIHQSIIVYDLRIRDGTWNKFNMYSPCLVSSGVAGVVTMTGKGGFVEGSPTSLPFSIVDSFAVFTEWK